MLLPAFQNYQPLELGPLLCHSFPALTLRFFKQITTGTPLSAASLWDLLIRLAETKVLAERSWQHLSTDDGDSMEEV